MLNMEAPEAGREKDHSQREQAVVIILQSVRRTRQPQKGLLRSNGVWGVHQQASSG